MEPYPRTFLKDTESRCFFSLSEFEQSDEKEPVCRSSSSIGEVWSVKNSMLCKHHFEIAIMTVHRDRTLRSVWSGTLCSEVQCCFPLHSLLAPAEYFWKKRCDQTENRFTKSIIPRQQKGLWGGFGERENRSLHEHFRLGSKSLSLVTFQLSTSTLSLGKVASGGWFVSGYARLLQCQYDSEGARDVL